MDSIVSKDVTLLSSPIIDEFVKGCYIIDIVLECEDLEPGMSTAVIEELLNRLENKNE